MTKKLYILGFINKKTVNKLEKDIESFKQHIDKIEKIYLFIDSDGGSVTAMFEIIEILEPLKEKLTTVALVSCKSSATFLFLLGKERLVIEECEFLMHRPGVSAEALESEYGRITLPVLQKHLSLFKDEEKKMKEFYKKHYVPQDLIRQIFSTENNIFVSLDSLLKSKMATGVCKVDFDII